MDAPENMTQSNNADADANADAGAMRANANAMHANAITYQAMPLVKECGADVGEMQRKLQCNA